MIKREVSELKKRFKKEHVTFSRLAGCYVDGNKNKICSFNEQFLTLQDEEFFKFLELAGKTLSGTMNNNLLNLDFPLEEELPGGHQQFLMGLRDSGLTNDALLDSWYDLVIENYEGAGNYLILLFLDAYDVMTKTLDDLKTGESEEVYRYLLCAVCPVALSKPGLGYLEEEKRIGSRIRDWVVGSPESGFLFPAFNHRSTDIHSCLVYTKDAKKPHKEMMEKILGCFAVKTNTEQKTAFHTIVRSVLGPEESNTEDRLIEVQQNLKDMAEEHAAAYGDTDPEPMAADPSVIKKALLDAAIPEPESNKIAEMTKELFGDRTPEAEGLIDKRAVANGALRLEKKALEEALDEKIREVAAYKKETEDYDLVLKVSREKQSGLRVEVLDGKKFLLVPVEDEEIVKINGEEKNIDET